MTATNRQNSNPDGKDIHVITPAGSEPDQPTLRQILELIFWAGQHNQYPDQNREPGTSVTEAEAAIRSLFEGAAPEKIPVDNDKLPEEQFEDEQEEGFTDGWNAAIDQYTANIKARLGVA